MPNYSLLGLVAANTANQQQAINFTFTANKAFLRRMQVWGRMSNAANTIFYDINMVTEIQDGGGSQPFGLGQILQGVTPGAALLPAYPQATSRQAFEGCWEIPFSSLVTPNAFTLLTSWYFSDPLYAAAIPAGANVTYRVMIQTDEV